MVHMYEYFYFRNHLCISFELLSLNLYDFIKNNNFQGLSLGLIRRFAQQLLVSLKYLRRQKVSHRHTRHVPGGFRGAPVGFDPRGLTSAP